MTQTENLYLAAFLVCEGATLERIDVSRSNGRNTAVFHVEARDLEKLSSAYYDGSAVVNLAQYRQRLEELRDRLFEALKTTETYDSKKRRPDHEADRQGRARAAQAPR